MFNLYLRPILKRYVKFLKGEDPTVGQIIRPLCFHLKS